MLVSEIFSQRAQPVSFEIFPPKGELSMENANRVAGALSQLQPDFISVTYSAGGGGNARATSDVAGMIQADFGVPTVAHLTCMGLDHDGLQSEIARMKAADIHNVLALRGDPRPGCDVGDFRFAKDLIPHLVDAGFCVGAAAYPEGHIDCPNAKDNIEHLKQKQDAGASFFVTQLFFDNEFFYRFREAADCAGISIPITAGIMPFLSKEQVSRMIFMCGASLPAPIVKLLARYEGDAAALRQAGIEYASAQLCDLAAHGADGVHIYTMNHPDIAAANVRALRA